MDIFTKTAEQRIQEAIERGELDNLPNSGKPLNLDDDIWVPEDIRAAYQILKNAGYVPPEVELMKEIISLRKLIDTIDDDKERLKKIRQLNYKLLKLNTMRKRPLDIDCRSGYGEKFVKHLIG